MWWASSTASKCVSGLRSRPALPEQGRSLACGHTYLSGTGRGSPSHPAGGAQAGASVRLRSGHKAMGLLWGILQGFTRSTYTTSLLPEPPLLLLAKASDVATRLELKGCMPCPCEKPTAGPTPQREEPALGSEQPAGLRTVRWRPGVRAQRQPPPCTGPVSEAAVPVATGLPGAVAGRHCAPHRGVFRHSWPWRPGLSTSRPPQRTRASVYLQSTRFSPGLPAA